MEHIITRQSHTGSQSEDGILEHQHQHSRGGTQTGKQGHRILTQQDGYYHHSSHEEHQYSEHTTEGVEILLGRRAALLAVLQSLERTDKHQCRAHRHHHDIDARGTLQNLLEYRIFQIDERHERPYHHSRNDVASRGEHLPVQQHIIPRYLRLLRNLRNQRNQYLATKEIAQHRQQHGGDGEQYMTEHRHVITRDTRPCYH